MTFPDTKHHTIFNRLSVRKKVAQCIMPRLSADVYWQDEEIREWIQNLVRNEGIGGVCVFQGDARQTASMLNELQRMSVIPLLVASDNEHGVGMRLEGATDFPLAMALGIADDTELTRTIAVAIGKEARALGIHWNFAPVADIYSNSANPVIGFRSFGASPELVTRHSIAYHQGLQESRVLSCVKHFPGHGDTAVDSHFDLPVLLHNRVLLESRELNPFYEAIRAGVPSLMVGHLAVPALENDSEAFRPASLSSSIMITLLREQWGFDGILITDALDMAPITKRYSSGDAAVRAFCAGADMILLPPRPEAAISALQQCYDEGGIHTERLENSLRRIIAAKEWCGLLTEEGTTKRYQAELNPDDVKKHQIMALDAAKKGIRWFGSRERVTPIAQFKQITGLALIDGENEKQITSATHFFRYLAQIYQGDCDFAFINAELSDADSATLQEGFSASELLVFVVFMKPELHNGVLDVPDRVKTLVKELSGAKPTLFILFSSPDLLRIFPATAYCCPYSHTEPSLGAVAYQLQELPV